MTKSILVKPIVSEKSEKLTSKLNRYTFIVDKKANKLEIKKAVETMYGITVIDVNTTIAPAKLKVRNTKSGIVRGRVSAYKKAFVTLAEGEELDIYGNIEE